MTHKPNNELVEAMIIAIESQKHSEDWTKDHGHLIPLPYTWLNGKRWEDELTVSVQQEKPDYNENMW